MNTRSAFLEQDQIKLENIRALGAQAMTSSHGWTATTEPIHVNDVTVPFQQRPQVRWTHGKNN